MLMSQWLPLSAPVLTISNDGAITKSGTVSLHPPVNKDLQRHQDCPDVHVLSGGGHADGSADGVSLYEAFLKMDLRQHVAAVRLSARILRVLEAIINCLKPPLIPRCRARATTPLRRRQRHL